MYCSFQNCESLKTRAVVWILKVLARKIFPVHGHLKKPKMHIFINHSIKKYQHHAPPNDGPAKNYLITYCQENKYSCKCFRNIAPEILLKIAPAMHTKINS